LQAQEDPYEIEHFPFIQYNQNKLTFCNDSSNYFELFEKLTRIGFQGEGKVSIVQIGDSHIQADYLSGNFRRHLQTFFLGSMGGRGFIFPYRVAKTNNPENYRVSSKGVWNSCRNVEKERSCELGLSGIAVTTTDSLARITISIDDPNLQGYDFDRLMVFHNFDPLAYIPVISCDSCSYTVKEFPEKGYSLFEFSRNMSSVTLSLKKTSAKQDHFTLFGFNFDSNDPGIIYHTVGVNGAKVESYLRCTYFVQHLAALNPDWVIVSLGTNDAYTNVFDTVLFKSQVDSLVQRIKRAAPNCAVLLTTPGDHRIRRRYPNENTLVVSSILKEEAERYHLSYWDFNSVMGGFGSISAWYQMGLAHTDFLHYTKKGYEYQAQLLFNAFLKSYDEYLTNKIKTPN